jgi:hypothetical protein
MQTCVRNRGKPWRKLRLSLFSFFFRTHSTEIRFILVQGDFQNGLSGMDFDWHRNCSGFLLGLLLGKTHDYRKKSVGTLLVGYTGEDDDGAHLFLSMDKAVEDIENAEYAILRVKKVKARN